MIYIAVVETFQCNRAEKVETAVSGRTFFYIEWLGHESGQCEMAPMPGFVLRVVSRSYLPPSGVLSIELQLQWADRPTEHFDTQVELV